jgi:hypothetical protein
MENPFFERPILNSPYEYPSQHWELDEHGQPTQRIIESRRLVSFITPIPKPRKRVAAEQQRMVFDEGAGLSTEKQEYDPTPVINELQAACGPLAQVAECERMDGDAGDRAAVATLAKPQVQQHSSVLLPD